MERSAKVKRYLSKTREDWEDVCSEASANARFRQSEARERGECEYVGRLRESHFLAKWKNEEGMCDE
jgi:hypothetical protein